MSYCLQADEITDKFLQDKHSFDDYVREFRRYHRLVNEITYKSVKVTMCIDCTFLYNIMYSLAYYCSVFCLIINLVHVFFCSWGTVCL